MRLAVARLAAVLMALGVIGGIACFVLMAGAESLGERAADGALMLVDVACLTALSFLLWPAGRA